MTWHSWTRDESARSIKQLRFNNANYFNSGAAVSIILISNWAILIFVHQHFHLTYSMLDMWANQHNEFKRLKNFFVKIALMLRKLFGPKVYFDWCSKKKKEISKKKEEKERAAPIWLLLIKRSGTPISLLLIKRSGTPPSLPILEVALGSGTQKSAAL